MLGISDQLAALCLDVAVFVSGRMAENEAAEAQRKPRYGPNPSDYRSIQARRAQRRKPQATRADLLNMASLGRVNIRTLKDGEEWPLI